MVDLIERIEVASARWKIVLLSRSGECLITKRYDIFWTEVASASWGPLSCYAIFLAWEYLQHKSIAAYLPHCYNHRSFSTQLLFLHICIGEQFFWWLESFTDDSRRTDKSNNFTFIFQLFLIFFYFSSFIVSVTLKYLCV